MGASSREFLMMREEEETGQLYVPTLPKKEIKAKAEQDVQTLLDAGEVDIASAFTDATRISEYLKVFVSEIKQHVTEETYGKEYDIKGSTISFRNTGDRLDYEQDEVYAELKERLKERETLLKTAYRSKETIYDSEGVEVSKVGVKTPSKQVVTIKY